MATTSAELFAQRGDPLATREDWVRESQIAASPNADTDARERAIAYTQRASMTRRHAQPKPAFREISQKAPVSERARAMQVERENLKLMLAGAGVCARTVVPVQVQERAFAERSPNHSELSLQQIEARLAEPVSYPAPKPLVDSDEVKRSARAHWLGLREHWAKDLNHPDPARHKRAVARIGVIDVELELLA